jgi:hypothetical protein
MQSRKEAERPQHGSMQDQSPECCMWKAARSLPVLMCRRRQRHHRPASQPKSSAAYGTRWLQQSIDRIDQQRRRGNAWERSRQYLGGANIVKKQQSMCTLALTSIGEPRPQPTVVRGMCHQRYMMPAKSLKVTKAEGRSERVHISAGPLAARCKTHTYLTDSSTVGWHTPMRIKVRTGG